jgi:two-component sensor histidine kinase
MDQMELRLSARRAVWTAQMMAREIDHRVMNSLQFISSLLSLQSRDPHLTDTAAQLEMAASRVAAVARVHQHFYSGEPAETVSCISFLRRLCADLSSILGANVNVHGDDGDVPTTWIQPIGLIVNELVTNASKHGAGKTDVTYRRQGSEHELSVCDEGSGLPHDFNPVTALARQLGGRVITGKNPVGPGSCFIVRFAG